MNYSQSPMVVGGSQTPILSASTYEGRCGAFVLQRVHTQCPFTIKLSKQLRFPSSWLVRFAWRQWVPVLEFESLILQSRIREKWFLLELDITPSKQPAWLGCAWLLLMRFKSILRHHHFNFPAMDEMKSEVRCPLDSKKIHYSQRLIDIRFSLCYNLSLKIQLQRNLIIMKKTKLAKSKYLRRMYRWKMVINKHVNKKLFLMKLEKFIWNKIKQWCKRKPIDNNYTQISHFKLTVLYHCVKRFSLYKKVQWHY